MFTSNHYLELLKKDLKLNTNHDSVSLDQIKSSFGQIVKNSQIEPTKILAAYVLGSYARKAATPYSDIDMDFFTEEIEDDILFSWNDRPVSIFVYPLKKIKQKAIESENVIWYKSVFDNAFILMDDYGHIKSLQKEVNNTFSSLVENSKDLTLLKAFLRRIIEYRRKIHSLPYGHESAFSNELFDLTYMDFAKKYIDNLLSVLSIIQGKPIITEKLFYKTIFNPESDEFRSNCLNIINLKLPIDARIDSVNIVYSEIIDLLQKRSIK